MDGVVRLGVMRNAVECSALEDYHFFLAACLSSPVCCGFICHGWVPSRPVRSPCPVAFLLCRKPHLNAPLTLLMKFYLSIYDTDACTNSKWSYLIIDIVSHTSQYTPLIFILTYRNGLCSHVIMEVWGEEHA